MMTTTPYTYMIGWKSLDLWYYGVRYAKGCSPDDLWVKYFTSSKYVMKMREEFGEPDSIRIARVFDTREEACKHELKFLTRMGVPGNPRFINKARQDSYHAIHTGMTGMKHRPETIENMRRIVKEKWKTRSRDHLKTDSFKSKMSKAHKGKPKSPEHAQKLRETCHIGVAAAIRANTGKKRPSHSQYMKEKHHDPSIYTFIHISGKAFTGTKYEMMAANPEFKPQGFADIKSGRIARTFGWAMSPSY